MGTPKTLSAVERDVMEHATAWKGARHRNYFATSEGTSDWPVWLGLVARGLAKASAPVDWAGGMTYFSVTPAGIAMLEAAPSPVVSEEEAVDRAMRDAPEVFGEWPERR